MARVVHLPQLCRFWGCCWLQDGTGGCWGLPREAPCAAHCVCWQGCLLLRQAYLKGLHLKPQAVLASMCCWTVQLYPSLKTNVKAPVLPLGRDSSLDNRSTGREGGRVGAVVGMCIPRMLFLLPPHRLLVSWLVGLARGSCQWMQVGAAAACMVPIASQLINKSFWHLLRSTIPTVWAPCGKSSVAVFIHFSFWLQVPQQAAQTSEKSGKLFSKWG